MKKYILIIYVFAFFIASNKLFAQEISDTANVFTLGEVTVTTHANQLIANYVGASKNSTYNRMDVSHALDLLPGINLSAVGPRNESGVYVHGFDLRQVPLYLDGIPVYVPYDGYVDLARFNTFDLSQIQISKGYSSVLYGPNAIGGAINLVTKKPVKSFEANAEAGYLSGGYLLSAGIGSKSKKIYWQVSASKLKRDYFPLSDKFDTTRTEDGGKRNNSYSDDSKIGAKLGFTPTDKQEYVIGYAYQHGSKGTPVYTGTDTVNSLYKSPRYWQWPNWDKQSVYVITNNKINSNNYIKGRLYYDQFKNKLFSYDDANYTAITKPYAFKSIYNDYTLGGSIEYGNTSIKNNALSVAVHFKEDVHREHNEGEPVRNLSDNNTTFAIEDAYHITPEFVFTGGFSYMLRHSIKVEGYNSSTKMIFDFPHNDNDAYNVQGALSYSPTTRSVLTASVARKTRFATMKDRYSYRLGTAIPNPDLNAENAINYNLDYANSVNDKFSIEASLFYSNINNTIQNVSNVAVDTATGRSLSQLQNTGHSRFYGADAGVEYKVIKQLLLSANYSYIIRKNISSPNIKFVDVPRNKVFVSAQYFPFSKLYLLASAEYNSNRFSTSYGTVSGEFAVVNGKASYKIVQYLTVEGGINNLFDRNYTLVEGFPEEGRNYFVNLIFNY